MKLKHKITVPFIFSLLVISFIGGGTVLKLVSRIYADSALPRGAVMGDFIVITFFTVLVLTGILIYLVYSYIITDIVKRVSNLLKGFGEVAAGNFDYKINDKKKDEISVLSGHFNMMTKKLKESAQKEKEAREKIIRSEKLVSLGRLSASLAHEINNPNGIIALYSQLLKDEIKDKKLLEYALTIERETVRIKEIITRLLSLTKQDSAEKKLQDLSAVVEEEINFVIPKLTGQNINLIKNIQKNIMYELNKTSIKQLVLNLILNAADALESKEENKTVEISLEKQGTLVILKVTDNAGALKNKEKAGEPFYTTKKKGTGLGLFVVNNIAAAHNGVFGLESAPNKTIAKTEFKIA